MIIVPGRGAQADPTVITACQEINQPGSYVLANDISSAGFGDCLTINVSGVIIDLAGFMVIGRDEAINSGAQGITVRNGSLRSLFGPALFLSGEGSIVEGLHVDHPFANPPSGGLFARGIVRGNTIVGANLTFGISASGIITDNYVSGIVNGVGIEAGGSVRGNTAIGNLVGIVVGAGSTVIGNTATGNTQTGIQAACPSNLTDNTAVNNGKNLVLNGDGCHNEDNVAP
jgi:parallel beta-helix repeat protein